MTNGGLKGQHAYGRYDTSGLYTIRPEEIPQRYACTPDAKCIRLLEPQAKNDFYKGSFKTYKACSKACKYQREK